MTNSRPVNLKITGMKFPITAIVSVLHRISGFLLFLFVPFMLWCFSYSLSSWQHYQKISEVFHHPVVFGFVTAFFVCLIYHFFAGVRHLIMDLGFGEGKCSGKAAAWFMLLVVVIVIALMGIWVWA